MARQKTLEHKTANIILRSARRLFIKHGFKGTSINDIANEANIHKSLIYHHFGNKENLWKAVKSDILKNYVQQSLEDLNFDNLSLRDLLKRFVSFRFNLYANTPDLARLTLWQRLEETLPALGGVHNEQLNTLAPQIIRLQEKGEIAKNLSPEMVSYFIFSTASNGFIDNIEFLLKKNSELQKKYLEMIIEFLYRALKTEHYKIYASP